MSEPLTDEQLKHLILTGTKREIILAESELTWRRLGRGWLDGQLGKTESYLRNMQELRAHVEATRK